jgi:hypothetical protein
MSNGAMPKEIEARASFNAYLVLAGTWILLGIAMLLGELQKHYIHSWTMIAITLSVASMWCIWIRGFRIRISKDTVEYQDGLYNCSSVSLDNIKSVRISSVEVRILGRALRMPRLIVNSRDGRDNLIISIKPFSRKDIQFVMDELRQFCGMR